MLYTDLPEKTIIYDIFKKNCKMERLIAYYQYLGKLGEIVGDLKSPHYINFERRGNMLHTGPSTIKKN